MTRDPVPTEIRTAIERLRRELVHGSSWYFAQGIRILRSCPSKNIAQVLSDLGKIRPGMASLENLIEVVARTRRHRQNIDPVLFRLEEHRRTAQERLLAVLQGRSFGHVVSLSFSSAVLLLAKAKAAREITLLRSDPGRESKWALREYVRYLPVHPVPDSMAAQVLATADTVVMGCDGIYTEGAMVNKTGSLPLVLAARGLGVPVHVLGESYKIARAVPSLRDTVPSVIDGVRVEVPLLESVPLRYLSSITTDAGTFHRPFLRSLDQARADFLMSVTQPPPRTGPPKRALISG